IESVLRRVSNSAVSQLPSHEDELRHLAVRLGFSDKKDFLHEYASHRSQAGAIIQEHLGG
ncbi:MAG: hypothetical protein JO151_15155, partial [Verrucomicrobia bacterium]|nr:hypothetical protein [Verrucomicrobiota bacterium]